MLSTEKQNKEKLRSEIKRTGVTPRMFFEKTYFLNDRERPLDLDRRAMNMLLNGKTDCLNQTHIDYIFRKYSSLGDNAGRFLKDGTPIPRRGRRFPKKDQIWIPITLEMIDHLRSEYARTGFDHDTILQDAPYVPERLNARIIRGWLHSNILSTDKAFWEYVVTRFNTLPNRSGPPPIVNRDFSKPSKNRPNHQPISDKDRSALIYQRDRTKVGATVLFTYAKDDVPKYLSSGMVGGWLSGNTKTAEPEHIQYILALYETLPTRK